MKKIKTVNDLPPGSCGIIKQINTPDVIKQHLMDMGIIEGIKVEMVGSAPLGDPVQIKVLDTCLALRRNEARSLIIEYCGEVPHGQKTYRHRRRFGRKSQ